MWKLSDWVPCHQKYTLLVTNPNAYFAQNTHSANNTHSRASNPQKKFKFPKKGS